MAKRKSSRKYDFIDHTADVEFKAYGKSHEELFKNALLALFDTISDTKKLSKSKAKKKTFTIDENARTEQDLLWFTLQDALSISDAEGLYGYSVRRIRISVSEGEYNIKTVINAKKKDQKLSKFDVKGVSQFDMGIEEENGGIVASVVLDV